MARFRIPSLLLLLATVSFPIMAQGTPTSAHVAPSVVFAESAPTNVRVDQRQEPATQLRLEDPERGGVLHAADVGMTFLLGPAEESSFLAGIEIEFLEPDTSVEIRVVDADGTQANMLVVSSPSLGRWRGDLCQLRASQNARLELTVLRGSALGTAYRTGSDSVTTIPILNRLSVQTAAGGVAAFSAPLHPKSSSSVSPLAPGTSSYTATYNWPGTSFRFIVAGGPPNTCGEIHTLRNNSWVITGGWLCTDGSGYGVKGPWNVTSSMADQRDKPTFIKWPDGTQTTETWHVIDTTRPTPGINMALWNYYHLFRGTATDGVWGSCFNNAWTYPFGGSTPFSVFYQDETTRAYWDDSNPAMCSGIGVLNCYVSASPRYYPATTDLPANQTSCTVNWSRTLPYQLPCPTGHTCSINIRVNDIWGATEEKILWP